MKPFRVPLPEGGSLSATAFPSASPSVGAALILAHGAGAGQGSPFMVGTAAGLAAHGLDTITFNFPYTEQGRRLPDRPSVLHGSYEAVIRAARTEVASAARTLFIGGKSMGGRIATEIAAANPELAVAGIVLLGYPLHPPGRPAQRRDHHLPSVGLPMLFVQGSRDAFGTPSELEPLLAGLTPAGTLHVVEGGDHSHKVSGLGRDAQEAVYESTRRAIKVWVERAMTAGAPR